MKNKYNLILSVSSDIGFEIAKKWLGKKKIIGTYLTFSNKIRYLKSNGVELYKLDFKNKKKIDEFSKSISKKNIVNIISTVGSLDPISSLKKVNFDTWTESIMINSINQIRCITNIIKNKKKLIRIVLFAGGGTNNATANYSAYTLSKMMLIKFAELIDFEMKNINCSIIGPGVVKTKLHNSTFINKKFAGENFKKIKKKLNGPNSVPISRVVKCIEWILKQNKKVISGRNISLVHDAWGSTQIVGALSKDNNLYKLRRFGNEKLIKK